MDRPPLPSGEVLEDWQHHQGTRWFLENLKIDAANALALLVGTARESSDPKVAAAARQYDILNQTVMTVQSKFEEQHHEDGNWESGYGTGDGA